MKLAVVMPAWNEAEGIGGFIEEIDTSLSDHELIFVVVDDASTDDTAQRALGLANGKVEVILETNLQNLGHGPSTLRALEIGLATNADAVVAVDGDGQFSGVDIRRVITTFRENEADIAEGVRQSRHDPLYRRAVSFATRTLVWSRCLQVPLDANTPLRVYRPEPLAALLLVIDSKAVTPNLITSALARHWGLKIVEVRVESRSRRGSNPNGTTWGNRRRSVPTRRFIGFCVRASRDWISTKSQERPIL